MPVAPALRRLGSEGQHGLHTEFQVHLGYGVCQLQNKKTWKRRTYWKKFSGADKEMRRLRSCSNITSLCDGCFLSNLQCPKQSERVDILSEMPFLTGPRSLNPSPQPFPATPLEKPAPGQSQCLHPSRPPMTENLFCPHIWITARSRTFPKC